jgi:hypothetical protein
LGVGLLVADRNTAVGVQLVAGKHTAAAAAELVGTHSQAEQAEKDSCNSAEEDCDDCQQLTWIKAGSHGKAGSVNVRIVATILVLRLGRRVASRVVAWVL